jgi:hypothetical protein
MGDEERAAVAGKGHGWVGARICSVGREGLAGREGWAGVDTITCPNEPFLTLLYDSPASPNYAVPLPRAEASVTLGQFAYAWLKEKVDGRVRDGVADRQLRFLKEKCFPVPNNVPPSIYICRRLLKVPDPVDFEKHVCASDKHLFPPLPRSKWHEHVNDTCECGHRRFHTKPGAKGDIPVPNKVRDRGRGAERGRRGGRGGAQAQQRQPDLLVPGPLSRPQVFYDFGVENIIKLMFKDKAFCDLRTTGRDGNPDDFYGSR